MKEPAELSRGLLRKAKQDRVAMEAVLGTQALDAVCFHAQQAAEKCLKAFLAHRSVEFPYTHNLAKLIEICAVLDPAFRSLLPAVAPQRRMLWSCATMILSSLAKRSQRTRSSALAVFEFVLDRLPIEIRKSAE